MTIDQVNTKRDFDKSFYYEIVYEWEDVIAKNLHLQLYNENPLLYNRIFKRLPLVITNLANTKKNSFVFDMWPMLLHGVNNRKNIIPNIIDFYVLPNELPVFYKNYSHNPIVLISSRQAYAYLQKYHAEQHIHFGHLALSLPDKYAITPKTHFRKKYDLVLTGRNNDPVLNKFLEQYEQENPDFSYVKSNPQKGYQLYDNRGNRAGSTKSREEYMNLMKQARAAFYIAHMVDYMDYPFHQITPRFLEYVACGCHILARYQENEDSDFYELGKFSPNITEYSQFKGLMDKARNEDVDMSMYSRYLEKHYTSCRTKELQSIISNL